MIAISFKDFEKYGCPYCGCDSAAGGNMSGGGSSTGICRECRKEFVILADGVTKSRIGFAAGEDGDGKTIFKYPELQEHPRKGIGKHEWVQADPRPEGGGEYWSSRGIGYDLSGFVKSKAAGERLLQMVKDVVGFDSPKSWLDWREYEPEWIQFKFQKEEFDLEKLDKMARDNNDILTTEILEGCCIYKADNGDLLRKAMHSSKFCMIDHYDNPTIVLFGLHSIEGRSDKWFTVAQYYEKYVVSFSSHNFKHYNDLIKWLDENTEGKYEFYKNLYEDRLKKGKIGRGAK